ncbi:formate/nitrite transporter family protein [Pelomicrobium sp.]|jgi:formate/nitrite transporter|uniref:formate/nitrite transporter family protein n=1 Tax=Pelomicrobium sp. TaxID=2815319 RepID=UPI002FDE685C
MAQLYGFDAYSPQEIADKVETVGVAKARLPLPAMAMLGVLAGGFIGLGALYFTLVASDASLPFAASRVLGGVAFSMGLILVVVAGAELFTGNNLLVMAWADRRITTGEMLRNWTIVYVTNAVGAVGLAVVVYLAQHPEMAGGAIGRQAVKLAAAKASLPFVEAFFKGVLCNVLVCLAVWLAMAGRSVTDKVLAIVFPISAFVAAGFEHSVANMYFLALGWMLQGTYIGTEGAPIGWSGIVGNLVPVTLGNVAGGSLMVALVYYLIYRRPHSTSAPGN